LLGVVLTATPIIWYASEAIVRGGPLVVALSDVFVSSLISFAGGFVAAFGGGRWIAGNVSRP
jgi:hypothetical protein